MEDRQTSSNGLKKIDNLPKQPLPALDGEASLDETPVWRNPKEATGSFGVDSAVCARGSLFEPDLAQCIKVHDTQNPADDEFNSYEFSADSPKPFEQASFPIQDDTSEQFSHRSSIEFAFSQANAAEAKANMSSVESLLDNFNPFSSKYSIESETNLPIPRAADLLTKEISRRPRPDTTLMSSLRPASGNWTSSPGKELTSMRTRIQEQLIEELRTASKHINVKAFQAISNKQANLKPTDIVIELGVGLMHLFDFAVPPFNHKVAVLKFYSNPGLIVQLVRGIEKKLLSLKVSLKAMQKLEDTLSNLTESKVRTWDCTGVAHIIYNLLAKAYALFQYSKSNPPILGQVKSSNALSPRKKSDVRLLSPTSYPNQKACSASPLRDGHLSGGISNRFLLYSPSIQSGSFERETTDHKLISAKDGFYGKAEQVERPLSTNGSVLEAKLAHEVDLKGPKPTENEEGCLRGARKRAEWNAMRYNGLKRMSFDAQAHASVFGPKPIKKSPDFPSNRQPISRKGDHDSPKIQTAEAYKVGELAISPPNSLQKRDTTIEGHLQISYNYSPRTR